MPFFVYCYPFEPRWSWSQLYPTGAEYSDYTRFCAEKYDVARRIRCSTAVSRAEYDESENVWRTTLASGETLVSRYLVNATGLLVVPKLPDIEGIEGFEGKLIHTARWDHACDLDEQTRRRDRHGRDLDPARPRDRRPGQPDRPLSAHADLADAEAEPEALPRIPAPAAAGPLPPAPDALGDEPARRGRLRPRLHPLHPLPRDLPRDRETPRRVHPERGRGSGDAGEADPELRLLLQAPELLEFVLRDASIGRTSSS